jgi:hypothetical protein
MIQVTIGGEMFGGKYGLWLRGEVKPYFTSRCDKGSKRGT